ncbi:MAG: DegT/DnrJ/EryC1/StrS family aminotransferase [Lachnospiraceae bacterium]|nr:DegT/DnrJ/EryC1/StrS family aminotransferase [Lachnospiraceae bacterium]
MGRKVTYGYDMDLNVRKLFRQDNTLFDYLADYHTIYLDSGRSCIRQLCQLIEGREILVPSFSCFAVIHAFAFGVRPVFYNIFDDFSIDVADLEAKIGPETAAVYFNNYYGHLQSAETVKTVRELADSHRLLVFEDNTQSIFSTGILAGDYALSSTRKWWAVPDGAVIYSGNELDDVLWGGLRQDSKQMDKLYPQTLKFMILKHRIDYPASGVADMFAEVEKELDEYTANGEVFLMSDFTHFIYECNSYPDMILKRRENERYLRSLITNPYIRFPFESFREGECPFQLPMYCETRDDLTSYMTETFNIFPSVLWRTHLYPEVSGIGNTARMGREIFSLPVDQRYDREDMEFLAEALNSYRPA